MNKYLYNFWKWGFLTLVALLLAGSVYVGFKASLPVPQFEKTAKKDPHKFDQVPIMLNKTQLNDLSAAYLNQFQKSKDFTYQFRIGKHYAILGGQIEVLGQKVQFALTMVPSVTKGGNIRLKAHSLSVGTLKLPAKVVLKYISRNYELPKWVIINGDQALLRLDQIKTTNKVSFQVEKIDIVHDQFEFIINVPKSAN
jgi:uncharacterized protein YpmS